jgi:uncharacterized protein YkwD
VSDRHETLLIDDTPEDRPRRRIPRPSTPTGRPLNPIAIALAVGGALAIIGLSFAVIAPLTGGSPHADALPSGITITAGSAAPGASTSTGPSTQPSTNPTGRAPSAAPTATGRFRADDLENEVVKLTNNARTQAGCHDVHNNSKLHGAARAHSADMAKNNLFSNTGSDGTSYPDRARKAGYRDPLGENIAHGPTTAAEVVQVWLSNGTTRKRIVDCDATNVGVGVARGTDGSYYWTQDFGK